MKPLEASFQLPWGAYCRVIFGKDHFIDGQTAWHVETTDGLQLIIATKDVKRVVIEPPTWSVVLCQKYGMVKDQDGELFQRWPNGWLRLSARQTPVHTWEHVSDPALGGLKLLYTPEETSS